MEKSIRLSQGSSWYLCLLFFWGVCAVSALCLMSKSELFLAVNHFRNPILDIIGTILTFMGDGIFTLTIIVFFIVTKNRKLAWILLCSFLLSTVFCHFLKNIAPEMRPAGYFPGPSIVKSPSWVSVRRFNSFPSGHTTTAFATATILAFYYKKVWISILCFLLAVSIGYSRVYLGQHFVGDVFTGSFLGMLSSFICIFNYRSPIIQKGLGLEYLFKKKESISEQNLERFF